MNSNNASPTTPSRPSSNPPIRKNSYHEIKTIVTHSRTPSTSASLSGNLASAVSITRASSMSNRRDNNVTKKSRSVSFSRADDRISRKDSISTKSKSSRKKSLQILTTSEIPATPTGKVPTPSPSSAVRENSISRGRSTSVRKLDRKPVHIPLSIIIPKQEDKQQPQLNPPEIIKKEIKKDVENQQILSESIIKKCDIFDHIGKTRLDFKDFISSFKVHFADALLPSIQNRHPVVRISIIDLNTGRYLKKSQNNRKATFSNENENLNFILPIMTNAYSFTKHETKSPRWEEEIVFNEDYLHLMKENVLFTFEILDFITSKKRLLGMTDGWHKIAWAFLKPIGGDSLSNTESKVRLQLYKYPKWNIKNLLIEKDIPLAYQAYNSFRIKYPATLHVTISGIPKQTMTQVKTRSRLPTEIEIGKLTLEQLLKVRDSKSRGSDTGSRSLLNLSSKKLWRYEIGIPFKIPNTPLYNFDTGKRGAFSCCFSSSGLFLAIACIGSQSYPIKIYDVLTGERVATLEGHCDLVYQLSWTADDSQMISASSDNSVRIWQFNLDGSVYHVGTLQHSTFVYSAKFHPATEEEQRIVATASYDGKIRIWVYNSSSKIPPICKSTISGHSGNINSLEFNNEGQRMYSADVNGIIKVWDSTIKQDIDAMFQCMSTIDIFSGIPINCISVHSLSRKLLVQTSSNTLHIIDTRISKVLTNIDSLPTPMSGVIRSSPFLTPLPNPTPSLFKRSKFSPCGNYILSGSFVYDVNSGKKIGSFEFGNMVVDVDWHPKDFTACFVQYSSQVASVLTFSDDGNAFKFAEQNALKSTINSSTFVHKKPRESLSKAFHNTLEELKIGKNLNFERDESLTRFKGNSKTVAI